MPFTFLMNGDALPSVTTSQILLRRHRPQATITSDGIFGSRTKGAVENFQSFHHLTRDGIIGNNSAPRRMASCSSSGLNLAASEAP